MKKLITVKNICIQYTDDLAKDLGKIISFILTQSEDVMASLPQKISLVKDESSDYIYIENFESYIQLLIDNGFFQDIINDNENILFDIYYSLINYECSEPGVRPKDVYVSEKWCYQIAAYQYYHNDKKFRKYLIDSDIVESMKIYHWLEEQYRETLFYTYLTSLKENFEENEPSTLKIMDQEKDELFKMYIHLENQIQSLNKKDIQLSSLTKIELDLLFQEYLTEIDPTLKWLNIYQKMINDYRIVFYKTKSGKLDSSEVRNNTIYLETHDNIFDFIVLAHEFAHYIEELVEIDPEYATLEFPSLFFEHIATVFLEKKGYPKKQIEALKVMRAEPIRDNYEFVIPLMLELLYPHSHKLEDKEEIDMYNIALTTYDEGEFASTCSYVIGTFLSNKALEAYSRDPENTIKKMIYITEHLAYLNIDQIRNTLGDEVCYIKKWKKF